MFCSTTQLDGSDIRPPKIRTLTWPGTVAFSVLEAIESLPARSISATNKGQIIRELRKKLDGGTRKQLNGALYSLTCARCLVYEEKCEAGEVVARIYKIA